MKNKCKNYPSFAERSTVLYQSRNLKMASSAHAYVRGNSLKFYEWRKQNYGGRGVDLVLDRIGGKGFGRNFEMLAPLEMVNSIGAAGADRRVLTTAPAGRRARAPTRTGRINRYLRGGAECAVWS
jgi:NADPH:quinone reductase-like Zn-dependent oxidoreductase